MSSREIPGIVALYHGNGEDATTVRIEIQNRFGPLSREEDRVMEDAIDLYYNQPVNAYVSGGRYWCSRCKDWHWDGDARFDSHIGYAEQ